MGVVIICNLSWAIWRIYNLSFFVGVFMILRIYHFYAVYILPSLLRYKYDDGIAASCGDQQRFYVSNLLSVANWGPTPFPHPLNTPPTPPAGGVAHRVRFRVPGQLHVAQHGRLRQFPHDQRRPGGRRLRLHGLHGTLLEDAVRQRIRPR